MNIPFKVCARDDISCFTSSSTIIYVEEGCEKVIGGQF